MRTACIMLVMVAALLSGCSSGEKKAAELLETARFEEKQNNFEHAIRLYDEILKKYPATPAARGAAERVKELKRLKPP